MSTPNTQADRGAVCPRRLHIVVVLATLCSGTLLADRIELKTGEVFFGEILRVNRREVSMRLESGGILSFRRNQIAVFRKNFTPSDEWNPSPDFPFDPVFDPEPDSSVPASPGGGDGGLSLRAPANPDQRLVAPSITDARNGFRLAVPRGFLPWKKPEHPSVLKSFYDPVTEARLDIVHLDPADESVESVKKKAVSALSTSISGLTLVRNQRVEDVPYEGWFVEFTGEAGGSPIRRLLLFARTGKQALLLRFSSPESRFHDFRRAFMESLRSFGFTGTTTDTEPERGAPQQEPPDKPEPNVDRARELLRLLKSEGKASEETVEEYLKEK